MLTEGEDAVLDEGRSPRRAEERRRRLELLKGADAALRGLAGDIGRTREHLRGLRKDLERDVTGRKKR